MPKINPLIILALLLTAQLFTNCKSTHNSLQVSVKNSLALPRTEVVSLGYSQLYPLLKKFPAKNIRVKHKRSGALVTVQWLDNNRDGLAEDELLFLAGVAANGLEKYSVIIDSTTAVATPEITTYARFVPAHADDFAWENDKVAFRVYGQKGQREARAGVAGSTLSSGVDIWLKRVTYPVINKWYDEHAKAPGYYHKDHGEGYGPYHMGSSRGTGGIGVWANDSLLVSENFSGYRVVATGPLRTIFELDYYPWSDFVVHETKRVSLDVGANFSKFEISLTADVAVPNFAIGISLHDNKGEARSETAKGWVRHWEAIDDSFMGQGIVIDPKAVTSALNHGTALPGQSNLLVIVKPTNFLTYYAGFAWTESGQVKWVADWDALLQEQADIVAHPLTVEVEREGKRD